MHSRAKRIRCKNTLAATTTRDLLLFHGDGPIVARLGHANRDQNIEQLDRSHGNDPRDDHCLAPSAAGVGVQAGAEDEVDAEPRLAGTTTTQMQLFAA